MSTTAPVTFGALLRQLRRRAQMTQTDLAAAVGYSVSFISYLEQNTRHPDVHSVLQHFVPALGLQEEPHLATHLLELAAAAQSDLPPTVTLTVTRERCLVITETNPEPPTNLPTPPTPLIGRAQTVKLLCDRLLGHQGRLLTLVGPPGVGKTRLALAVAAHLQPFHPDGVYFVPLAPISDPALVASALVSALAIVDGLDKPPEKRLIEFLRRKELLLLLDNFEQISAAAPLVATLLAACPGVRILVTSRERLHLRAEQRYPVQPLAIAAACELFVQRARAVDPTFALTAENQPLIAAICQRLDCLPLALELSAVQVDLFSPSVLLTRLQDQRLDLLTNGLRDLPDHHQTLRKTIERSYGLLREREQSLLRTLSVFVGGFDRMAVIHFGFGEQALQALINKSLVLVVTQQERERRFMLLETIRAYANEMLNIQQESQMVQERHAHYFLALAENAYRHIGHETEQVYYEQFEREHDNLRAALRWSLMENPTIALQLTGALREFWCIRGYYPEGGQWLVQALQRTAALPSLARARALYAAGKIALNQADDGQATIYFEEALSMYSHLENQEGIAASLTYLGIRARNQHDPLRAKPLFEQSLALRRQIGDSDGVVETLGNLAFIAMVQGHFQQAKVLLEEGLAIARTAKNAHRIATTLANLGYCELQQGAPNIAMTHLQESMPIAFSFGYRGAMAFCFERMAEIIGLYGGKREDKDQAAQLLGVAAALRKKLGAPLAPVYQTLHQRTLALLRTELGEAAFAQAWAAGEAMSLEEGVQVALTSDLGLAQGVM